MKKEKFNSILDDEFNIPGNDFYCIGVQADYPEDLNAIIDSNEERLTNHIFEDENYEVLHMGEAEIWRYGNDNEQCAPFYNAGQVLKLKFEEFDKSTASAATCYLETEFGSDIPFVFISETLNLFEYLYRDYSKPCDAKLIALANDLDFYESEAEFNDDYPCFAAESFFPLTENDEMVPGAVINGHITYSEILTNEVTGCEYYHFKLACQGYEFDCFIYDQLLNVWDDATDDIRIRVPKVGDVVHGTFRIEVKIV